MKLLQLGGVAHLAAVDVDLRRASSDDLIAAFLASNHGQVGEQFVGRAGKRERRSGHVGHQCAAPVLNHWSAVGHGYALKKARVALQAYVVDAAAGREGRLAAYERHLEQARRERHRGEGECAVGLGHAPSHVKSRARGA